MSTPTSIANMPQNVLGVLDKISSDDVTVYQGRCVRVRNRNATCTACMDACTSGAIECDENGRMVVTPSRCIGCGTCATVCPTCALEAHNPTDEVLYDRALAAARNNANRAIFACGKVLDESFGHVDESKVTRVTCLGRIDESLLVSLAQAGVCDVRIVEGACAECEHITGWATSRDVVDTTQSIFNAWGVQMPIAFVDELPEDVRCENAFYSGDILNQQTQQAVSPDLQDGDIKAAQEAFVAGKDAEKSTGEAFTRVGKDGTLPHFVPTRRGRLLNTLAQMGPAPEDQLLETRLWGEVTIDPQLCGSCRMCAVFCPTGALRTFSDRKTATQGIEHEPGKCVACGACEDICPRHAVTLNRGVFPSDLYDGHTERFEIDPPAIPLGKPDTIVRKMRGILSDSQFVNQA